MNVDRSKSFYVLSWVHDLGPISEIDLADKLKTKYGAYDAIYIKQRIDEQTKRGVFNLHSGFYQTSLLGNLYWKSATLLSDVFKLDG